MQDRLADRPQDRTGQFATATRADDDQRRILRRLHNGLGAVALDEMLLNVNVRVVTPEARECL